MTYANVVYSYGTERFAKVAAEIGMDGLILPDVPFEEHGLDLISLIAPTSHERIAMIAKEAENGSPVRWSYCSFSNCEAL